MLLCYLFLHDEHIFQTLGENLKLTWNVRKLIIPDPSDFAVRLDQDNCLELFCLLEATELVSSKTFLPMRRFVMSTSKKDSRIVIVMEQIKHDFFFQSLLYVVRNFFDQTFC